MKKLTCNIKIGKYSFTHVVELVVNTSIEQLTDTCTIELPRKLSWKGKTIALGEDAIISTGDRVTVKTGYDGNLKTVFEGYLKHIKPGIRVKLTIENEMYRLKQSPVTMSFKDVDLATLLGRVLPSNITFKPVNMELGQILISNMTPAKVLEKLSSDFGIFSYFLNGTLYSGFAYWPDEASTHKLEFKRNIIDDSGVEFIREEDLKIRVKAVSILKNNTKIEKEFGDADGDLRTVHFYNVPADSLQSVAQEEIKKLKYTGLQGSLNIFGEPFIVKGDVVQITDPDCPEKNGNYLVKGVEYRYGTRAYRQKIQLGPKV